jgi:CheY-like chemotaxis protein
MAADDINPDVVILELQLVQHSGAEFLYEFRSYPDWQNVPVIIYTQIPPTQFHDTFQDTCRQLGVSEYLYKPTTSLQALLLSVRQALAVRS